MDLKEYEFYGKDCMAGTLPPCSSSCPLNVNLTQIIGFIQKEKFTTAYKHYRDQTIFPGIVSEICDAPCKEKCLRLAHDEGLEIGLLEKAIVKYASSKAATRYNLPKKDKKIIIIGGGITGLTCAIRLGMKNYQVVLYEKTNTLGGRLNDLMDPELVKNEIETQTGSATIEYVYGTTIDSLEGMDFDAALIATGEGGVDFGLKEGLDTRSFGSLKNGVFLAGALLGAKPIHDIAQAMVASHSIEKYLKVGAMDGIEDTFYITDSEITVDFSKTEKALHMPPDEEDGYSEENAVSEAKRCLLCDCWYCRDACELFDYFDKKPRQLITDAVASAHSSGKGSITKQTTTQVITSCKLCGLCDEVCPKNIDIGMMAHDFRHIKKKLGQYPLAFNDYYLRDLIDSNIAGTFFGNPSEKQSLEYAFFPGCQIGASDPAYVTESYNYLLDIMPDTAIMIGCCGAPADWGGEEELRAETAERIRNQWETFGRPKLICACSTCMEQFETFLPEIETISIYQIIAENGLPAGHTALEGKVVSVFDPCTSRNYEEMQKSVKTIVTEAGGKIEELPFAGKTANCCGMGGQTSGSTAALAELMIQNRILMNEHPYINYCSNCRDLFTLWEKQCFHVLDIVFPKDNVDSLPQELYDLPTLDQRRRNRAETVGKVKELFFNDSDNYVEFSDLKPEDNSLPEVSIPPELKNRLLKRLIMEEEIRKTVDFCERTSNKIHDSEKGTYTGHMKIGLITLWIEYKKDDEGYTLCNAYSHRMEILEEAGRDG